MPASILHGDCLAVLPTLPANSIDAIVTDPPAGIAFMGKTWDKDKGGRDHWIAWMQQVAAECLRCIKPGGHALVWALPRTSHWTATAWENAGWDVRDIVHHVFGSGFPKSLDVSKAIDRKLGAEREVVGVNEDYLRRKPNGMKTDGASCYGYSQTQHQTDARITAPATPEAQQFAGWGTALKPAVENWILLRKPLIGTVAQNVLAHGTGGINVDATRVPAPDADELAANWDRETKYDMRGGNYLGGKSGGIPCTSTGSPLGRWPPNLLLSNDEEVLECFPHTKSPSSYVRRADADNAVYGNGMGFKQNESIAQNYGDEGSAARFFPSLGYSDDERRVMYCPKASKRDRAGSKHPTVKPQSLMRWLCRLITPIRGTVLDPFAGSGSTGEAASDLGMNSILIEQDATYIADIRRRLAMFIEDTEQATAS